MLQIFRQTAAFNPRPFDRTWQNRDELDSTAQILWKIGVHLQPSFPRAATHQRIHGAKHEKLDIKTRVGDSAQRQGDLGNEDRAEALATDNIEQLEASLVSGRNGRFGCAVSSYGGPFSQR